MFFELPFSSAMFPKFQFHFVFPFTRLHPPSPCPLLSGDPKQSTEVPFYCPGNGVIWGFRLFRCTPSKILSRCWNSEIVERWKAGPLLLLFQTKSEIMMDFDFSWHFSGIRLVWAAQILNTVQFVCEVFVCVFGFLCFFWFGLVWLGGFCVS